MKSYTVLFKTPEMTSWKPCRRNATFATKKEAEDYISTCIMYSHETEYKIEDMGLPVDSTLETAKDDSGYPVYNIKYEKAEVSLKDEESEDDDDDEPDEAESNDETTDDVADDEDNDEDTEEVASKKKPKTSKKK